MSVKPRSRMRPPARKHRKEGNPKQVSETVRAPGASQTKRGTQSAGQSAGRKDARAGRLRTELCRTDAQAILLPLPIGR